GQGRKVRRALHRARRGVPTDGCVAGGGGRVHARSEAEADQRRAPPQARHRTREGRQSEGSRTEVPRSAGVEPRRLGVLARAPKARKKVLRIPPTLNILD